ncbi:VQ motif-containing protein 22-like [Phalaenopsis equestris]|uniref:VQ motif-containing protein 22-like n=1 Tax=Phalaenopsis equestris TaxID=78828 RepID=UPI0009E5516D|nr:VQ motif-containing protein 22-like [Phalaenopsis equestris]
MPLSIDAASASGSRTKPARKRSRTSRRAPTTLLNTDTSNFRAMVQQFTGVPSVPYTTSYVPGGGTTLNFGIGYSNPVSQSTILPSFGVHETRPNQYHYQQQQQQDERYMLPQQNQYRRQPQPEEMIGFGVGSGHVEDDGHMENSREVGIGLPEEFFIDGMGGQGNQRTTPEHNRGGGYFL